MAEVVWGAWQQGWDKEGLPYRFRSGSVITVDEKSSDETKTVMTQIIYLQTEYEKGEGE